MNRRIEEELHELFSAIDGQMPVIDPPTERVRARRSNGVRLLAAAAAVAVAAIAAAFLGRPGDVGIETADTPSIVEDDVFDALAGEVCERLERDRSGVRPRFETPDAYIVSAREQRVAVQAAVAELDALLVADDEGRTVEAVVAQLQRTIELLDDIEAAARAGDLVRAAELWGDVDVRVAAALSPLADRGASCEVER